MSLDAYHDLIHRDLPLTDRGCASKSVFVSRREARAMGRHGRLQNGALRPYHCRRCAGWHLGHPR